MKTEWENAANEYQNRGTLSTGTITQLLHHLADIADHCSTHNATMKDWEKAQILTAFAAYSQSVATSHPSFADKNQGIDWESFGKLVDVVNYRFEPAVALAGHRVAPTSYQLQQTTSQLASILTSEVAALKDNFKLLVELYPTYKQMLPIAPLCHAASALKIAEKYPEFLTQVCHFISTLDFAQPEHRVCFLRQVATIGEAIVQSSFVKTQQAPGTPLRTFLDNCVTLRNALEHAEAAFSNKAMDQNVKSMLPDVQAFITNGSIDGCMLALLPHGNDTQQFVASAQSYIQILSPYLAENRVAAVTTIAAHELPCPNDQKLNAWYKLQKLLGLQHKTARSPDEDAEIQALEKDFFEIQKKPIINTQTGQPIINPATGLQKIKTTYVGDLVKPMNSPTLAELALLYLTHLPHADAEIYAQVKSNYCNFIKSVVSRVDLTWKQKSESLEPCVRLLSASTDAEIQDTIAVANTLAAPLPQNIGGHPASHGDYDIAKILEQMICIAPKIVEYKNKVVFGGGAQEIPHAVREYYQCIFGSFARALLDTESFVQQIGANSETYKFLDSEARAARSYLAHNSKVNLSKPQDSSMHSSDVFSSVIEEMQSIFHDLESIALLAQLPPDADSL